MSTLAKILAALSLAVALSAGAQAGTVKPAKDVYGNLIVRQDASCAVQLHIACPGSVLVGVGY